MVIMLLKVGSAEHMTNFDNAYVTYHKITPTLHHCEEQTGAYRIIAVQ